MEMYKEVGKILLYLLSVIQLVHRSDENVVYMYLALIN